jgi:hypothetical protein
MLDIHQADGNQIKIAKCPTDLLRDVLEPVSAILYKRVASFEVEVVCPDNLIAMMDPIQLKQVVMNLCRNSSKFVQRGFIHMRAAVEVCEDNHNNNTNHHQQQQVIVLYMEDSGPGIPPKKHQDLFAKYQQSLDLLSQGTSLGLNLSKKLMQSMDRNIYLDETYDSGRESCLGAGFVIELNAPPMNIEDTLPSDIDSDNDSGHTHHTMETSTSFGPTDDVESAKTEKATTTTTTNAQATTKPEAAISLSQPNGTISSSTTTSATDANRGIQYGAYASCSCIRVRTAQNSTYDDRSSTTLWAATPLSGKLMKL